MQDAINPDLLEDRIFLGEGLFETIKVNGGKALFVPLHWERLSSSAQKLGLPLDMSYRQWHELIWEHLAAHEVQEGGIKCVISASSSQRGLTVSGQLSHIRIQHFEYLPIQEPVHLMTAAWKRDEHNPIYRLKSTNYLEAILAKRMALTLDKDDALFFNTQGHATETTIANIYIIHQDTVYTPKLEDGVLPGITRQRLKNLCARNAISFKESSLNSMQIQDADLVFTTNVLQGIRVVSSLDNASFNLEHPLLNTLKELLLSDELDNGQKQNGTG